MEGAQEKERPHAAVQVRLAAPVRFQLGARIQELGDRPALAPTVYGQVVYSGLGGLDDFGDADGHGLFGTQGEELHELRENPVAVPSGQRQCELREQQAVGSPYVVASSCDRQGQAAAVGGKRVERRG